MEFEREQLMLIRRALEMFEDRCTRLYKSSTHEPLRAVYRRDIEAVGELQSKLLELLA